MFSVYIATRFQDQEYAKSIRNMILRSDLECSVTCSWLDETETDQSIDAKGRLTRAFMDYFEVTSSNVLVVLNPYHKHGHGSGGFHLETGIALAKGIPVVYLGEPENIFHYLPSVIIVNDMDNLLEAIRYEMNNATIPNS